MKPPFLFTILLGGSALLFHTLAHAQSPSDPLSVEAPKSPDFILWSVVKIKAGMVLDFKKTLFPYAERTRQEPGCLAYVIHQSPDDPTQLAVYEHWKSDEARSAHLGADYTVQFFKDVKPMFEAGFPLRTKFIELK